MNGKIMESLQRLGKALMGAVAVMPVAAILMGIGYWFDPTGWGSNSVVAAVLIKSGAAVLDNLGWLFAIALAFGLSRDNNGAAALSGFIGFATIKMLLNEKSVAGFQGIDLDKLDGAAKLDWASQGWGAMGDKNVLVGIFVGILAAWVYNRFSRTKLPPFLAFFSGRRLVPILTSLLAIVMAGVLYFAWPFVYSALFHFGQSIQGMGALGAGIYAFANR
ncbi:PTS transporter subunit EIIC, partial [Arcanobacterium phocae]